MSKIADIAAPLSAFENVLRETGSAVLSRVPEGLDAFFEGLDLVVDACDGLGMKIGFTTGPLYKRVRELQTGNPRVIRPVAEITNAGEGVERALHTALARWNTLG